MKPKFLRSDEDWAERNVSPASGNVEICVFNITAMLFLSSLCVDGWTDLQQRQGRNQLSKVQRNKAHLHGIGVLEASESN